MPDPITWYALGRDIANNQSIIEEIQAEILAHNMDASAHGQSSEAVYNHRISEILDHVSYSIYNAKINPASRVYQAIVGDGLSGDFSGLQEAIDWTNLYGGGRILIKKGTYVIPGNLTLYSNIILEGEDADLSILDFDGKQYQIKSEGTSGTHKRNIELRKLKIVNSGWYDTGVIRAVYVDAFTVEDCVLQNFHWPAEDITTAVLCDHCTNVKINRNTITDVVNVFNFESCSRINIEFNDVTAVDGSVLYSHSTTALVFRHNSGNDIGATGPDYAFFPGSAGDKSIFDSNYFTNIKCPAFVLESTNYVGITNNYLSGYGTPGDCINAWGSDRCVITNNRILNFSGDGININNDSDYNVVVGNVITSCGAYGVRVDGANCNKNVVVGNSLVGNSSGGVLDTGTGTINANNGV